MTDLPQPQTTQYSSRGKLGRYPSDKPPETDHISFDNSLIGKTYGKVTIISAEKRYTRHSKRHGWTRPYVLTRCQSCGKEEWTLLENLSRGLSKGCQMCTQPRTYPKWLDRRFTAAKQRCTNPKDGNYKNYGARGISFDFASVKEACLWMIENCGLPDRSMELDRIDVNGNYAPGNLRWVTHQENCQNQRRFMT